MAKTEAAGAQAAAAETKELGLLDQIVNEGRFGNESAARERGKDIVKRFLAEVLAGTITVAADTEVMLNARIAQIDRLVSKQLKAELESQGDTNA